MTGIVTGDELAAREHGQPSPMRYSMCIGGEGLHRHPAAMTASKLRTANQVLSFFRDHPQVRVIRLMGTYQIHRVDDGRIAERMATYDLTQLKEWAARW